MACTIWGRTELGNTRTYEIFMLWAILNNHLVNTCFYLLDYLSYVGNRSDGKGEIIVGGIITYIARQLGVSEDQRINNIEGNNRLKIETLISMNFIKHRPPMTYRLKLNVPVLFILPNPSRTNTEVEENLMYVGDGSQVHEEHNQGEEEGENLHHNEEHHDHDGGGNFENERWAWMQTEVERISTEQQRQGVELSGL